MRNKTIIWSCFLIIFLAAVGFLIAKTSNRSSFESDRSKWKTYQDNLISIQYPQNMNAVFRDGRIYFQSPDSTPMEIAIDKNKSITQYKYLGFPQGENMTLGNNKFIEFKAPNGYCENNNCGRPFSAYTSEKNGNLFTVIFYGDDKLTSEEKAILASINLK